jgi:hypothetical protein
MAYYIFLKSLRSLEEFRKNPHVKIPPKSLSTNFQSIGKFKNPIFLIQKFFFLFFGPADLVAHSAFGPASPAGLTVPAGRNPPSPAHPTRASVESLWEYAFPFGSRLPSWSLLPRLSVKRALAISSVPHLRSPELGCAATASRPPRAAQLRASSAVEPLPPRHHFPSP